MDLVLAELTALRAQVAELADLRNHLAGLPEGSGQRNPPDPPTHASSL